MRETYKDFDATELFFPQRIKSNCCKKCYYLKQRKA